MEQPENHPDLTPDTGAQESEPSSPNDPQHIKSGSASSPGGKNAPDSTSAEMTHGQDDYPGPRADGETAKTSGASRSGNAEQQ